jgi:2-amino-4-hydroxy-6-hydroxymethyldihydropteridine diphosphokinase
MARIFIGLGSNLGDKKENLGKAVERLREQPGIKVSAVSSFYETKPVGGRTQDDYLNGVIKAETDLTPMGCLIVFKGIEKEMGRVPAEKDAPRVIDLDILLYDDTVMRTEELTVPHPRMHEREFVLRGLAELAPEVIHPVLGRSARELFKALQ